MFRLITIYFCIGFLLNSQLGFTISLKDKFQDDTTILRGSFIVTEHQKTTSFLRVHSFKSPFLFLEEINIPSYLLAKKNIDWNTWLKEKAPNHTSWLLYQIDLNHCKIVDCYSFSRNSYIALHDQQSFLTTLMTLPLQPVPSSERKKIGANFDTDALDTSKVWNPPKIIHGIRQLHPHFEMMHARWPKDDSELSGKLIDLYFDLDQPLFPFPYWIEIGDGHNVFKIRVIDSGSSMEFPFNNPPTIEKVLSSQTGLDVTLKHGDAFIDFQLILSSEENKVHTTIPLPCSRVVENGVIHLHISQPILKQYLNLDSPNMNKNLYTLCVIPLEDPSLRMEYPHPIRLYSTIK